MGKVILVHDCEPATVIDFFMGDNPRYKVEKPSKDMLILHQTNELLEGANRLLTHVYMLTSFFKANEKAFSNLVIARKYIIEAQNSLYQPEETKNGN